MWCQGSINRVVTAKDRIPGKLCSILPEKGSEGVFYELYTVTELIIHVASGFVSV